MPFLLQYLLSKSLNAIVGCYANGIKTCLSKGVTYFLVSEDLLQFSQSILHSLVEFRTIPKPILDQESLEQQRFLVDNNLTLSLMQQDILLN